MSLVASTSGLTLLEVALLKPLAAAVSAKLASASLAAVYRTPLKVAMPAVAFWATVASPSLNVPLPFSVKVTLPTKSASTLPKASVALTTGWLAKTLPLVTAAEGWVVKRNSVASTLTVVPLLLVTALWLGAICEPLAPTVKLAVLSPSTLRM